MPKGGFRNFQIPNFCSKIDVIPFKKLVFTRSRKIRPSQKAIARITVITVTVKKKLMSVLKRSTTTDQTEQQAPVIQRILSLKFWIFNNSV